MNQPKAGRNRSAGFSLIELMVALVAGLIVLGAVLAFTVSSVKSNSDFVKSTRLMQELRNSSDFITSELKRAGYDEAAMTYLANPVSTEVSLFAPILVSAGNNCVIYAYDRQPGRPGKVDVDNGEIRGIRRATTADGTGVIEVAESTATVTPACNGAQPDYSQYPTTCNAASGWCPLSDPRSVDIRVFTVNTANVPTDTNTHGLRPIPGGSTFNALQLREFQVTLAGNLRNDPAVTREVRANIKVRADCLRQNLAACILAPVSTPP